MHPNQLYRQESPGRFREVGAEKGVDIPELGAFLWLDADNDGDADLLWADNENLKFWLYVNYGGQFQPQEIGSSRGLISQLTMADFDGDRDLDVFAASTSATSLLMNLGDRYQLIDPSSIGLPVRSRTASWIDFDNDQRMDFHGWPDGIFRQNSKGQFVQTHLLEVQSVDLKAKVFCTWLDADNDGTRDLLVAMNEKALNAFRRKILGAVERKVLRKQKVFKVLQSQIVLYKNIGSRNHWLQIQLTGPNGNAQAIGATVEVTTNNRVQRQTVGQAEGSVRSQGHYRLYFGLGPHKTVDAINITWPDGIQQELQGQDADQLLTLTKRARNVTKEY